MSQHASQEPFGQRTLANRCKHGRRSICDCALHQQQHQHGSAGCCTARQPATARFAGAQRRPQKSTASVFRCARGRHCSLFWRRVDRRQPLSRLEHHARPTTCGGGLAPPTDHRPQHTNALPADTRASAPESMAPYHHVTAAPPPRHRGAPLATRAPDWENDQPPRRSPPPSPAPTRSRATSRRATASRTPPCA